MIEPPTTTVFGRVLPVLALAVCSLALYALVRGVVDWRGGSSISGPLVSGAVLALGVGMAVEIPDYRKPPVVPTRRQRAARLLIAAASVALLATSIWARQTGH